MLQERKQNGLQGNFAPGTVTTVSSSIAEQQFLPIKEFEESGDRSNKRGKLSLVQGCSNGGGGCGGSKPQEWDSSSNKLYFYTSTYTATDNIYLIYERGGRKEAGKGKHGMDNRELWRWMLAGWMDGWIDGYIEKLQ
ncbi:unnamed protein product [Gongylonema pulchrum]|uniref:Uncharacterized protein n=1 Tax=Gongylonema pulchrum TaxID=637853 RepID=A0A183DV24_9BILA|nr:unnamed protein product [Gongylonema pulchrum]